jgi:hypothetical protein
MDDNDELNYISSVSPFVTPKADPSVDAPDESALKRVAVVIENQINLYQTLNGVKQFSTDLSLEQRFELCDHYTSLLVGLLLLVNSSITGIKEQQNG